MRIIISSIFPEFVRVIKEYGVIAQALRQQMLQIEVLNLRDFTHDKHRTVDDYPYGGGPGMVMKPEPFFEVYRHCLDKYSNLYTIMTSPQGVQFNNRIARHLSEKENLLIFCGRYEGVDERVMKIVDMEISIGDYVLSGGELAAMVICDAVSRFVPGVIDEESAKRDSFYNELLDYPHYTRPAEFDGMKVPDVLLSGNHEKVELFRIAESLKRTAFRRPDLFVKRDFSEDEKKALIWLIKELAKDAE
ncbi:MULTISPECIES: tRNA (guanosine(37)-N1)-methyltransferase TrmD [Pseudothermotoga]|jgi:tRNA (guanine37-N1)-methyltransferase|uniref:tRNA (guanine-N(1)-)-methyltransferase n=1 Tax=Pseudothermotoga lettingae (strain ATCC BAA-301 / DSM 14385 / NBRC 107922 / TMO) TaxID=416591 RepID=A8F3G1_PSELT|nr:MULTISPECIES: tRNA (guanosine(37)-N1)-methyltransferase TrmD [Pseudothermotoga]ABV32695.1 tRNA (guanine-N1)-methyltransferase [Pseudothermotoga lettingae TMO]KUK21760.1 MAG: tRNA (guanine-N(1)-)-methyltransferase [Pseudothermotoga lettingae]MDI3495213.1 tRNA (guanine37-N1)-methyltransferase [Pseudothermotoga sp.]MDK2885305.1 tRNA (guanine37-N1)-methyltransferase [Pseudothermotoga sp.]GLI48312.1 tRNA (guanine-N(1)-)-methyltransferase [Pseudothermotoga lettingae TMO]